MAFSHKDSGKYIPKTILMTPDLEDTLAYAPYARSSKERLVIYKKAVADFKKNYKKVMAERKKAEKEKAEAES